MAFTKTIITTTQAPVAIGPYSQAARVGDLLFTSGQVALDPANHGGVSGFHEMDNFRANGFYATSILPTAEILDQDRDFTVLTSRTPTLWLQRRILSDPRYTAVKYGSFEQDINYFDIWLVHTR